MVKKLISSLLIAVAIMAVIPKGVSAEWENSGGMYKYKEGNSYVTGWKNIDNDWYCFDSNGVTRSGWISDNGNWYFCYVHGQMAKDTWIGSYWVDRSGAWTKSMTVEDVKQIILKEDGNYISKNKYKLSIDNTEYTKQNMPYPEYWNFPQEAMFGVYYGDSEGCGGGEYFVGKESGNIYIIMNQGEQTAYQIKNNQIVKSFKWLRKIGGMEVSHEWR